MEGLMWEKQKGMHEKEGRVIGKVGGKRGKPEAVGKLADQIWVRREGGMFGEGKLGGRRSKDGEGKSRGTARETSWGPGQNGQSLLPRRV